MIKINIPFIALCLTTFLLSACGGGHLSGLKNPDLSDQDRLLLIETAYTQKPEDKQTARLYAAALAKSGDLETARNILAPIATDEKAPITDKIEYAAILSEMNDIEGAQAILIPIIEDDITQLTAIYLLNNLYAKHEESHKAQDMLVRAYQTIKYAPNFTEDDRTELTKVITVNYISQEKLREALSFLKEAKRDMPNNIDIERNIRIVRALMQSNGHNAPKPLSRPNKNKGS